MFKVKVSITEQPTSAFWCISSYNLFITGHRTNISVKCGFAQGSLHYCFGTTSQTSLHWRQNSSATMVSSLPGYIDKINLWFNPDWTKQPHRKQNNNNKLDYHHHAHDAESQIYISNFHLLNEQLINIHAELARTQDLTSHLGTVINLTARQFSVCPCKEGDKWKRVMMINVCLNKECLHKQLNWKHISIYNSIVPASCLLVFCEWELKDNKYMFSSDLGGILFLTKCITLHCFILLNLPETKMQRMSLKKNKPTTTADKLFS